MKIKSYFLLTLLLMATVAFGSVKPIPVTAATIEWKAYKIAYERWGTIELESGELDFEEGHTDRRKLCGRHDEHTSDQS